MIATLIARGFCVAVLLIVGWVFWHVLATNAQVAETRDEDAAADEDVATVHQLFANGGWSE